MKILITGNMGYVGPVLVRYLRSQYNDIEIIGFDTAFFGHCLANASTFPESCINVQHFGDVREFPHSLLEGVDAIIHLAAISNDPMGELNAQLTFDINRDASIRLAKTAKRAGRILNVT